MQFSKCSPGLLRVIDRCVRADRPVQLTLMGFPFKVPNPAKVGPRKMPDLAELASLVRLHHLNAKVKSVYPPGLEIHLIHDGSYIADLFQVAHEEVLLYERYFARLIHSFGASPFIHVHDFQPLLDACSSLRQQMNCQRNAILDWQSVSTDKKKWAASFWKTLGMIDLRSLPLAEACRLLDHASSGHLPPEYGDLERSVRAAMLGYYVLDSLLHACDPRPVCFPDAIHVTTQCRPDRLAIWIVSRGRSLLPWHGVGVIDSADRWNVALARDVLSNQAYEPVFLDGENTPFFYRQRSENVPETVSERYHSGL